MTTAVAARQLCMHSVAERLRRALTLNVTSDRMAIRLACNTTQRFVSNGTSDTEDDATTVCSRMTETISVPIASSARDRYLGLSVVSSSNCHRVANSVCVRAALSI
jgi:hypothetical protein